MAALLQPHKFARCRSEIAASPPSSDDTPRPAPSRLAAGTRKAPRNFALQKRGAPATAVAVTASAPSTTPPSVEDRKKSSQDSKEASCTPFKITEVDAAVPKDFYDAPVLKVADVAPGVRCITVETEISREFVPLDKAYTKPGQAVCVRLPSGSVDTVAVSSAPFSGETNFGVLYKLRGDIPAGATKAPQYALSVRCPLDLHVVEKDHPQLYNVRTGDSIGVGQFERTGMDLRPVMFLSRFPTLLIFASGPGAGIAAARALIEAEDVGSLYTNLRSDVRLYYSAPTPQELAYQECFPAWAGLNVKARPVVARPDAGWQGLTGDFALAFDEDDLEYDPETTAAVVCGDASSNAAALRVLDAAGIPRRSVVVWEQK